jgi:hypothetical protein
MNSRKNLFSKLLILMMLTGGLVFALAVPGTSARAAKRCCLSDAECGLGKSCVRCKCVAPTPVPTPSYTTAAVTSTTRTLDNVNGNKIVADSNNVLHAVYADNGIKYISSINYGKDWSLPITLSATGITPTIGVDDFNNLGVAYSDNNKIYYFYKLNNGGWSGSTQLTTTVNGGNETSIIGYGSKMYLTWASFAVRYTEINTISPLPVTNPEFVSQILVCGSAPVFRLPSIALINSTGANPTVRVAYFSSFSASSCSANSAGIYVKERGQNGGWFTNSYGDTASNVTNPEVSSVSMAANRDTGEFFLAYSFRPSSGGLWKTKIAKSDQSQPFWDSADLFGGDTSLPVVADVGTIRTVPGYPPYAGTFRLAYFTSQDTASTPSYANIFLKEGNWTIGTAPNFWSTVKKADAGRMPHLNDRGVTIIYETYGEVRTDFDPSPIAF